MQQNSKYLTVVVSFLSDCLLFHLVYNDVFFYRGCLLVRQSFFHNNPRNFADLGSGVLGCRGFHSSFRATQGGLSLNMGKLLRENAWIVFVTLLSI